MRALTLATLLATLATPTFAEGPGNYSVSGTNPGGDGTYKGTATLSQTGRGTWSMTWRVGKDTYAGYGVGDGKIIAITYTGASPGIASYVANSDGTYSGIWTTPRGRSVGTETLTPQ